MVEYDTRVQLTDIVREQFLSFTSKHDDLYQASSAIIERTGISMGYATLTRIKNREDMPKTIALPVYMLVCPDETLAVELGSIQNQGVPKLVQVYAEQKYLGYSHEKAIALMAKEIESSLGIKSDTVKRLLDTTVQRTKPVAIDVSIPIYLASKLDIIGDYTEILASLGYKLIKPKRHPLDEDDTKLVAGFMESSGRILKLLSKLERNPDGTVSVSVKISRLDVDLLNSLGVDVD